jgi:DNA-binding IclR family transcriptional regulator
MWNEVVRLAVKALAKACHLLTHLAAAEVPQPLHRLARAEGLPASTAYRLLETMCAEGLVEQLPDRRYRVGLAAFQMARAAAATRTVLAAAEPVMAEVAAEVEESVSLVLFRGEEAHYLRCIEGPRTLHAAPVRLGGRLPVHCTASGKVLLASLPPAQCRALLARAPLAAMTARTLTDPDAVLAQLEAVRAQGHAVDDQELEDDLVCVAAPIRDHTDLCVAALSVSGHRARIDGDLRATVIARVRAAAARISIALGARVPGEPGHAGGAYAASN